MEEWRFAQAERSNKLARVQHYSFTKPQQSGDVEFLITVKEYADPESGNFRFFAQADKDVNQREASFRPCGWGSTLLQALSECIRNIEKFEYTATAAGR